MVVRCRGRPPTILRPHLLTDKLLTHLATADDFIRALVKLASQHLDPVQSQEYHRRLLNLMPSLLGAR
ncbi:hypothetical protein L226DRAFT_571999 [Lentinus tigrinus ALCF2SS1-7]|uniref:uncharacterized protein n=1 Tax=Lentinus tigrinus ALCF2SS1-7 TaxID=1328758 RepID=UPI0011663F9C|nr:hypothetical protein L226DRAFT_571999 [Lentinus tigrinus ALCF2SS1-7]